MRPMNINFATSVAAIVFFALVALPLCESTSVATLDECKNPDSYVIYVDSLLGSILDLLSALGIQIRIKISLLVLAVDIKLSDDAFKQKYGHAKPAKDASIICIAILPIDAKQAAEIIEGEGYSNVKYFYGNLLN